jgi:hypothetical protein
MTSLPKRKPARVTHGTCRLAPTNGLTLDASLESGDALLTITPETGKPTNYTVLRLSDSDGRIVGFRLTKLTQFIIDQKTYDVDVTPATAGNAIVPMPIIRIGSVSTFARSEPL